MNTLYDAVLAVSVALLSGAVLQIAGVSAGNGMVIDWREVRSGETLLQDGDAFDVARLFIALVGESAAFGLVRENLVRENELPASHVEGSKVRIFGTKKAAGRAAKSIGWPAKCVSSVTTRFQRCWALSLGNDHDSYTGLPYLSRERFGELYRERNGNTEPNF